MPTTSREILDESIPGAAEAIQELVEDAGGWHCEQHPALKWPHDDCPGPGMLRSTVEHD